MKVIEWILSCCLLIWILILAGAISTFIGYSIIILFFVVYILWDNGYFGGER